MCKCAIFLSPHTCRILRQLVKYQNWVQHSTWRSIYGNMKLQHVCVFVSICLLPRVLPNDKTGTQSSRWAYSHLRTLRCGSRFGSGRAGGLIRSLGNNKNLSCTKDSAEREREKELSFRDKTAASVFAVCSVQLRPMHCQKLKINTNAHFS